MGTLPTERAQASLIDREHRDLIARQIKAEMAKRGLTQAKLGEMSAYDERTIRNVLSGRAVRDRTLFEICASLGIELGALAAADGEQQADGMAVVRDRPAIATLPFANLSGDSDTDFFVDGIVGDIITELSRFSELVVIAHNSTSRFKGRSLDLKEVADKLRANYVVKGSVRRSSQRVRISVQLIDARSGIHLWAERYDRELADIFSVQDDIAQSIASILVAHVKKAEPARVLNKPPENWAAYEHYLRAHDIFSVFPSSTDVQKIYAARRLLSEAIALDPSYARAYALLAATHMATWVNPLDNDVLNPAALERAYNAAQRAVQLDPRLPQGHGELGHVLLQMREHDLAIAAFDRACALNPNYIHWRHGAALSFSGYPERAIETLKTQMLRDPFYPVQALSFLGHAYFVARRYCEAIPPLREAVVRAPDFRPAHLFLAATYSRLSLLEEARSEASHVMRIDPGFSISRTPKLLAAFKNESDLEHFLDSLRVTGLPE